MHEAPELVVLPPALPETGCLHGLVDRLGDVLLQPDAPKDAQQLARRLRARLPCAGVKVPTIHAAALRRAVANCTDVSALLLHIGELTDTTPDDVVRRVLEVTPRTPRRKSAASAANEKRGAKLIQNSEPSPARVNVEQFRPLSQLKSQGRTTSTRGATTTTTTTRATPPTRRSTATTSSTISTAPSRPARRSTRTEAVTKRAVGRKPSNGNSNAKQTGAKPKNNAQTSAPGLQDIESTGASSSTKTAKVENARGKIASKQCDEREVETPVRVRVATSKEAAENSSSTVSTVRSLSFRSVSTGSENGTQTPGKSVLRARHGRENRANELAHGGAVTTPSGSGSADGSVTRGSGTMAAVSSPMTPGVDGGLQLQMELEMDDAMVAMTPRSHESVRTAVHRIEQIMGVGKRPSVYARAVRNALIPAGYRVNGDIQRKLMFETSRCVALDDFIAYAARQVGKEPIEVALACSRIIHDQAATTPIVRPSLMSASNKARRTNISVWSKPQRTPSKVRAPPFRPKSEPQAQSQSVKVPQPKVVHVPGPETETELEEEEEAVVETRQELVYEQNNVGYVEEQVESNELQMQHQAGSVLVPNEYIEQNEYDHAQAVEYTQNEGAAYAQDGYTQQAEEYTENEYVQQENVQYVQEDGEQYIQQQGEEYMSEEYTKQESGQHSQDGYTEQDGVFYTHSQVEYVQQPVQQVDEQYYQEGYDEPVPEMEMEQERGADQGYVAEIDAEVDAEVEPYNPSEDVVEPVLSRELGSGSGLGPVGPGMHPSEIIMKEWDAKPEPVTLSPAEMALRDTMELVKTIRSKSQSIVAAQRRIRALEDKILELQVAQRQVNIPTVAFTMGIFIYGAIFYFMLYQS